jgi:hypothetical protein
MILGFLDGFTGLPEARRLPGREGTGSFSLAESFSFSESGFGLDLGFDAGFAFGFGAGLALGATPEGLAFLATGWADVGSKFKSVR